MKASLIKYESNACGEKVIFDVKDHIYRLEKNGKRLISVTQTIDKFAPEFHTDIMAKRSEATYGEDASVIKHAWREHNETAKENGSWMHNYLEAYALGLPTEKPKDTYTRERCKHMRNVVDTITKGARDVVVEKILFSEKLGLAGTVDLLVLLDDGLMILDWKTSAQIIQFSRYHQKMLSPIEYLEDCNFVHYSLQLNFYKRLLIEEGYYPDVSKYEMGIVHIRDKTTFFPVNHMDSDIDKLLNAVAAQNAAAELAPVAQLDRAPSFEVGG